MRLRRLRARRGLTQEGLAFRAGVSKNHVQLIESGRASGRRESVRPANPGLSTLHALSLALDVDISELLDRFERSGG